MPTQYFGSTQTAQSTPFNNATDGLEATNVQSAIEETPILDALGDGSDGVVSLSSGTTTLARDMYYSSLTLSGSAILDTNGWKIYCLNTITLSGTANIRNPGNAGTAGSGQTNGNGGALTTGNSVGIGTAGQAGVEGVGSGNPAAGNNAGT